MSESNSSSNNSKDIRSGAKNTKNLKKQGSNVVRMHESITSIPELNSAPPSGNIIGDPLSHPLSLPPPPPPPPPRVGTSQFGVGAPSAGPPPLVGSSRTGGAFPPPPSSSSVSTLLPPPPRILPISTERPGQTGVAPPPPPPPVRTLPPPPLPATKTTTTVAADDDPLQSSTTYLPSQQQSSLVESSDEDPSMQSLPQATSYGPTPPPFLPVTTFAPKECRVLARRQTHIPIMIIATEAANRMAWKNGLQLVDLFQGIVEDLRPSPQNMAPFRSIYRSLLPTDISVQFVEPGQMDPLSYDEAHEILNDNARLQARDGNVAQDLVVLEDRVDELLQERRQDETLEEATKDAHQLTSPLDIPWLIRYRHALDVSTNALPHDLINCPPIALLVCTTDEIEEPEQVLQELRNSPHVLPDAFKRALYDPQGMRHEVLVLHDAVHGPPGVDENQLRQSLQSQFGPNSAVLRINSVLPETALALADQEATDLWGGNGKLGNFLSVNDRVLLRRYFQSFLTTSLLPALERRIADLNAIVNERKKGVRNLVKSFWRKPKDEQTAGSLSGAGGGAGDGDGDEVKYRYDSIESQTRLLADTLFLIQDYDAALSIYRLIRDDYKSDKALSYYASVQEMMALCMYRLDPYTRGKEIFSHLETALLSYTRAAEEERAKMSKDSSSTTRPSAAPHATRLATRLCLILAAASDVLTRGREVEVADLLASASSHESSLGAAVLLEQSSAFYYVARMYRKYAFHMLMSGHMFRSAGQDHHAFRCFTSALFVYRNGGWHELHNHLRSALAAQLYNMERYSIALILYAKLVGTASGGKVSAKSQQKFLQHLIEICEDHKKSALAGADRMASPPSIPSNEREAFRNSQLDRIVNVIRYTMGASRVLELPYVALPRIIDSSVRVWTKADQHFDETTTGRGNVPSSGAESSSTEELGKAGRGKGEIWDELELMSLAELKAVDDSKPQLDETVTAALSKVSDPKHRRVLAEVDKERHNRILVERSKRNGSRKPKPAVRSRGEPMFCTFVMRNPLGVDVQVTHLQLVVTMLDKDGRTCTNQFAIQLNDGKEDPSDWTFASSGDLQFSIPDFCRISEPSTKACKSAKASPFYVVTKHDIELAPGGETSISAGLTPLVDGELQILGVRYKLSGKVWLYHPFDIPGPLLKDTRTNIMNRVRGESNLLKSKIEGDMPCLSATLVKRVPRDAPPVPTDGGPLLDGQISSWTIRIRNDGTAPATKISLKTNLPWVNIVESKANLTTKEIESQPTSRCLGPSGTLMSLSLEGKGTIAPGETLEIPIQIRTSGNKKQEFYMLYCYELAGADENEKPRKRWLRRMYEVSACPSLSFDAKVLSATWKGKDTMLSIELTNNRMDRPTDLFITLDNLSLASRFYRLVALPDQFMTNEEFGNVLQIGWQERITVHFRVIPLEVESPTCLLSQCAFSENGSCTTRECASTDAVNFLCLEQAFESFEAASNSHQLELLRIQNAPEGEKQHPRSIASIRRANTSDVNYGSSISLSEKRLENQPTSIGNLCPPDLSASKIHLICTWRAILGQEVIHGEHHIRGVCVRPLSFVQDCPVIASVTRPCTVSHDYSKGPALVPMKVTLRNRMLESPVDFYLVADPTATVELSGSTRHRFRLEPSAEISISYQALIPRAGIHDLQVFRLTLLREKEEVTYSLSQQWLVDVSDSST